MSENEKNEKKEIEVVTGNGKDLEVSPVFEHLNALRLNSKGKEEKKKKIIIPKVKKRK